MIGNFLFLLVLFIRFSGLQIKPPHHDETINGWFTLQTWTQGGAPSYDPSNYHGPLLFWIFQVAEMAGFSGVVMMRFVTVLFSVLTLWWLERWMRERLHATSWWLWGLLLSPGFLFFSRSAIHESGLVFFMTLAATGAIDYWIFARNRGGRAFFYGVLGALLLKETFVFPVVLILAPFLWSLMSYKEQRQRLWSVVQSNHFHLGFGLLIWFLFYSRFGARTDLVLDFFKAYLPWFQTGMKGNGHEKSMLYFLSLLWRYEPATIGALIVVVLNLLRSHWSRWVSVWALAIFGIYSAIPYKTPWCLISLQVPLWLACGVTLATSRPFQKKSWPVLVLFALSLGQIPLLRQLNFEIPPSSHPYVYVQTLPATQEFVDSLKQQIREDPERLEARFLWGAQEPWPFPWWLKEIPRQTSQVWDGIRDLGDFDVIVLEASRQEQFQKKAHGNFWKKILQVRDAREESVVYLKKEIFRCPFSSCEEFHQ